MTAAAAGLLAWAATALSSTPPAAAAASSSDAPASPMGYRAAQALHADFDGDGYGDLIVGLGPEANAVQVIRGSAAGLDPSTARRLSQDTRGVPGRSEPGDWFGMSLAVGDFNGDGYTDAVIGAPGESVGTRRNAGSVTVIYGGRSGLRGAGSAMFTQNSRGIRGRAERGDRFGTAVVVGDFNGDRRDDIAIGVPGERLGSAATRSGSVEVLYGSREGITAAGCRVFDAQRRGMRDSAASGGGDWGAILAAGDFTGDRRTDLAIGVPGGYVKDEKHAGFVQLLYGSSAGITHHGAARLTRATTGVPGRAGQGLPFGLRLATGDYDGDHRVDLAVNDTLLQGSASGLSGAGSYLLPIPSEFTVEVLRSGDITGDGPADLLLGGRVGHDAAFGVLAGSSDGLRGTVQETLYPAQAPPDIATDVTHNVTDLVVVHPEGVERGPALVATDAGFDADWSSAAAYVFDGTSDGVDPTPTLTLNGDNTGSKAGYQPSPLG